MTMSPAPSSRIGVDTGGTFTDLVWVDDATGAVKVGKLLTTPKDPSQAVEQGVVTLLSDAGGAAAEVRSVIHGTTLATNALIERKGARTGLLTTAGFRDAVEIGHEGRYDMYDIFIDSPAPLVPRHLRLEVVERMAADGHVLTPLEDASARAAIGTLREAGAEAIAICLLHAYGNPVHERALEKLCAELAPGVPVSTSSEVVPEIREYERTSTTCGNVYVMPLMARYLDDLERKFHDLGIPGRFYIMLASGGQVPTVTDADLLLGYLDPGFFLGGRMRLDVEAARRAVEEKVARPMGLTTTAAAWGIHRVVNENMAAAARVHGIERGKDLRAYPLFAFGGAGPVHAWQVGRILKVPRVLVPFGAGAMSAYGLLAAPLAFDFVRTASQRLDAADWAQINGLFGEMEEEGRAVLRRAGVEAAVITIRRTAEMRYTGQGHEVEVEVPAGTLSAASLAPITANFEAAYRALYSRTPLGVPIEALNFRVVVSGPVPEISVSGPKSGAPAARVSLAPKSTREAYFPEARGYVDTPVYDRYALQPGAAFQGPAIIEERESTTVAAPGARVRIDDRLTLIMEPGEATR